MIHNGIFKNALIQKQKESRFLLYDGIYYNQ